MFTTVIQLAAQNVPGAIHGSLQNCSTVGELICFEAFDLHKVTLRIHRIHLANDNKSLIIDGQGGGSLNKTCSSPHSNLSTAFPAWFWL